MSPDDLNTRDNRGTAGDGGAVGDGRDSKCETFPRGTAEPLVLGDGWLGQVWKKTGREDTTSSTAVLLQDGRTAPLRTLRGTSTCPRQGVSESGSPGFVWALRWALIFGNIFCESLFPNMILLTWD